MSHKLPIKDIKVIDRARRDLGKVDELVKSISRVGLINPICVRRSDYRLIAGECRLIACRKLGYTHIDVKFYEDLTDVELMELELEENVHKEFSWYETSLLRTKIHTLKQQIHGKATRGHASKAWGLEDTAKSLGISIGTISQDFQLVEFAASHPTLKEISSKRKALNIISHIRKKVILAELAHKNIMLKQELPYILVNSSAEEALKEIDNEIINLIITDLSVAFTSEGKSEIINIIKEFNRILKPDSHLYIFFDMQHYQEMYELLSQFFTVDQTPLIWIKEREGNCADSDSNKFIPQYETLFFCSKGKKTLNFARSNVFIFSKPTLTERINEKQKPSALLSELIKLSSSPNELVLDAFAGSGATIEAAVLNKRRALGIEKDPVLFSSMQERLTGFKQEDP